MNNTALITMMRVDDLVLDPNNPRLPEDIARDENSIIEFIAETTAIEDLMQAIAQNDFFEGEPVVAIHEEGKFIVVEGNRRLTAVRLLSNPNILLSPSARIITISKEAKFKPDEIPVIVRKTRQEVLPYLGFRHITGVKQWEPLAKARYIEQIFNSFDKKLFVDERYSLVAKTIGSRKDHIRRNLDALAVYRLLKQKDFFNIPDLSEKNIRFAVLSTAIADEKIGSYLGVSSYDKDGDSYANHPILDSKKLILDHVQDLANWLYKTNEKGETRVGESRNLRYLSTVVGTPKALEAFKGGSTLSYAYRLTKGASLELKELLYEAEDILARAGGFVANVEYEQELFDLAKQLREKISLIGKALQDKKTSNNDF